MFSLGYVGDFCRIPTVFESNFTEQKAFYEYDYNYISEFSLGFCTAPTKSHSNVTNPVGCHEQTTEMAHTLLVYRAYDTGKVVSIKFARNMTAITQCAFHRMWHPVHVKSAHTSHAHRTHPVCVLFRLEPS